MVAGTMTRPAHRKLRNPSPNSETPSWPSPDRYRSGANSFVNEALPPSGLSEPISGVGIGAASAAIRSHRPGIERCGLKADQLVDRRYILAPEHALDRCCRCLTDELTRVRARA